MEIKSQEDFITSYLKDRKYPIKLSTSAVLKNKGTLWTGILIWIGVAMVVSGITTQQLVSIFLC